MQNTEQRLQLNERASLSRPGWTSEPCTGNLEAYKHFQRGSRDESCVKDYFVKTGGLLS